jgi:uridine phosphorylase
VAAQLQYHIRCKRGDVGEAVLLPGDPGRSEVIARLFDNPKLVARNREFVTYTGTIDGRPISVCSTGIGSPSTAIAVEELLAIGVKTFIRVGTTGSIQDGIHFGDVVIASAAVRDEGTTPSYVPLGYPAVADPELLAAFVEGGMRRRIRTHTGIVRSHDSLYTDLQPKDAPRREALENAIQVWHRAGVLCNDMETSTIFIICSLRRARAGSLLMVVNEPGEEEIDPRRVSELDLTPMFQIAIDAVRRLQPIPTS